MKDEEFRSFCVDQIKRLGVFNAFQFLTPEGRKEFRKFFEARTRDESKVINTIDEAVKLESIPTIFEMSAIWNGLFPPDYEMKVTAEEKAASAEYRRKWYAQELESAQARRAAFLARNNPAITKEAADRLVGRSNG